MSAPWEPPISAVPFEQLKRVLDPMGRISEVLLVLRISNAIAAMLFSAAMRSGFAAGSDPAQRAF